MFVANSVYNCRHDYHRRTEVWMNNVLDSCKPSVRRRWLVFAAGVVWLAVGIGLMAVACYWLYHSAWPLSLVLAAVSFAMGLIVYSFGFSRIVRKNRSEEGR